MAAKSERKTRKRFKSQFRIYLGEEIALGPGKADLLHHISETGSISKAAHRMEMSYNRAWLLVRTMNRCFKEPLVLSTRGGGGKNRGGAQLTEFGKKILALHQQIELKFIAAARQPLNQIMARLKD